MYLNTLISRKTIVIIITRFSFIYYITQIFMRKLNKAKSQLRGHNIIYLI